MQEGFLLAQHSGPALLQAARPLPAAPATLQASQPPAKHPDGSLGAGGREAFLLVGRMESGAPSGRSEDRLLSTRE